MPKVTYNCGMVEWIDYFARMEIRTSILEFLPGCERRRFLRIFALTFPHFPLNPHEWQFPIVLRGEHGNFALYSLDDSIDRSSLVIECEPSKYRVSKIRGERSVTIRAPQVGFWTDTDWLEIQTPPQDYLQIEWTGFWHSLPSNLNQCLNPFFWGSLYSEHPKVTLSFRWTKFDWLEGKRWSNVFIPFADSILVTKLRMVKNETWVESFRPWLHPQCQFEWVENGVSYGYETMSQPPPAVYHKIEVWEPSNPLPPAKIVKIDKWWCIYHCSAHLVTLDIMFVKGNISLDVMFERCPKLRNLSVLRSEVSLGDQGSRLETLKFDRWGFFQHRTTPFHVKLGELVGDQREPFCCQGSITFDALHVFDKLKWKGTPPTIGRLHMETIGVECGWLTSLHTIQVEKIPTRSKAKKNAHRVAWPNVHTIVCTNECTDGLAALADFPALRRLYVLPSMIDKIVLDKPIIVGPIIYSIDIEPYVI